MVYIVFLEPGFLEESKFLEPGFLEVVRTLPCSLFLAAVLQELAFPDAVPQEPGFPALCCRTRFRGRACSGIFLEGVLGGRAAGARIPGDRAPEPDSQRLQRLCCPAVFLGGVFGGSLPDGHDANAVRLDESAEFLARLKERTGMKTFEIWAR